MKISASNERLDQSNDKLKNLERKSFSSSNQNIYHSFKQAKQFENAPSIVCAGCDRV